MIKTVNCIFLLVFMFLFNGKKCFPNKSKNYLQNPLPFTNFFGKLHTNKMQIMRVGPLKMKCILRKVHFCVSSFTIDFPVPVTRTLWLSAVLLICEIAFKIFAYANPCSEYYISWTKLIALHPTNRKECNTSPIASIWVLATRTWNKRWVVIEKKRPCCKIYSSELIQKVLKMMEKKKVGIKLAWGLALLIFVDLVWYMTPLI